MRKRKTVKVHSKMTQAMIERTAGHEPENGSVLSVSQLADTYNLLHVKYTKEQAFRFLLDFLKENRDEQTLSLAERLPIWAISRTACWIAYLKNKGCILPGSSELFFRRELATFASKINKKFDDYIVTETEDGEAAVVPSNVIEFTSHRRKSINIISMLEEKLDQFITNGYRPTNENFHDLFIKNNISRFSLNEILTFYEPLLVELQTIEKDATLQEAYRHLSKSQLQSYLEYVKDLIGAAYAIADDRRRQRKPRTAKAKKPEEIAAKLRYLAQSDELKVVSLLPEKILNAESAWIFDTGTRILSNYVSEPGKKLTIQGPKIGGYSERSVSRRLRQPHQIIPVVVKENRHQLQKTFDGLTTIPKKITSGRTTERSLILRVF